ncbi:rhodanese-like domain-containing protein [Lutibacter sp.]|uniref:rhodanese-like domain-containing protein n=1 Tax=Lutibacter sp. TaxID=1925666 RepID=UPI0035654463
MNIKLKLVLVLSALLVSLSCNSKPPLNEQEKSAIHLVNPSEFKEKSVNQVIIDIRTPQEFSQGHIEGAININYYDNTFMDQIEKFDKSKPIFLYCRSGNRTSSASARVAKLGFGEVYDLQGGIMNWARHNQQIIK